MRIFSHSYEKFKVRSGSSFKHEIRIKFRVNHEGSETIFNSIYRTDDLNKFHLVEQRANDGIIDYTHVEENVYLSIEDSDSSKSLQDSHFKRVVGNLLQQWGYMN